MTKFDKESIELFLGFLGFSLIDGKEKQLVKYCGKYSITIDFSQKSLTNCKIDYGKEIIIHRHTTTNFSNPENLVVLECVIRLLEKGYPPNKIEIEKSWKVGGYLDVFVKDKDDKGFLMIECKQWGEEYDKALGIILENNFKKEQLFNYYLNDKNAKYLALYTSSFIEGELAYRNDIIPTALFEDCKNQKEIYEKWDKTFHSKGIFEEDIAPYNIKFLGLLKKDLKPLNYAYIDVQGKQGTIYNRFAEILRRHTVSDKNNAYNKIFNLFLCKIVDEDNSADTDELKFQWIENENPEDVLIRLNDLYKEGMRTYLQLEVADVTENEFDGEVSKLISNRNKDSSELKRMFKLLRLYKDNEFAFKEVINERTFLENAEVVKEVVKLLEQFKIKYSHKQQFLGDFFERLLNIGIKQESGQFFTPLPIATFICNSIDFEKIIKEKIENKEQNFLPYVIDYACGSGHFLTESMDRVDEILQSINESKLKTKPQKDNLIGWKVSFKWAKEFIYGIENDYRLAKTTKVASFLNGDGEASVLYADGLDKFSSDNYYGKLKSNLKLKDNPVFDVVVANPPYAVESFKYNLKHGEDSFDLFDFIGEKSDDIECLFVERTKQLLKVGGVAGIILPSTILLNKGIQQKAREIILKYFKIVGICELGNNTFAAAGQNTVVLFLERKPDDEWKKIKTLVEKSFETKKDFDLYGVSNVVKKYIQDIFGDMNISKYFNSCKLEDKIAVEKEKLFYYLLTFNQRVVVIRAGEKEDEKKFLGYEHSAMRKYEGIHPYPHNEKGLIYSALFDNENKLKEDKANTFIIKNFRGEELPKIPASLKKHIEIKQLNECLDFGNYGFNYKINLEVLENTYLNCTKYELVTLATIKIIKGKDTPIAEILDHLRKPIKASMRTNGNYPYYGATRKMGQIDKFIFDEKLCLIGEDGAKWGVMQEKAYIIDGKSWVNNHVHVVRPNTKFLLHEYLAEVFNRLDFSFLKTRPNGGKLQKGELMIIKFPLPSTIIQKQLLSKLSKLKGLERAKMFDSLLGLKSNI